MKAKMSVILAMAAVVSCQVLVTAAERPPWSVTISPKVLSKYVFPGNGYRLYGDPVVQTGILVSSPYGVYFDLWHSTGLNGKLSDDFDDEVDVGLGWTPVVAPFVFDVGVRYLDEPELFGYSRNDILQSWFETGLPLRWRDTEFVFTPFAKFENYFVPDSGSIYGDSGGNVVSLGLRSTIQTLIDGIEFPASAVSGCRLQK